MPPDQDDIWIRPGFTIPDAELELSFVRSSGPGGQNVNKTATKVRLKWCPAASAAAQAALFPLEREELLLRAAPALDRDGYVQVVSERHRTREENRAACRRRLAERVRGWLRRRKKRVPTRPTAASRRKRVQDKQRRSRLKGNRRKPPPE